MIFIDDSTREIASLVLLRLRSELFYVFFDKLRILLRLLLTADEILRRRFMLLDQRDVMLERLGGRC